MRYLESFIDADLRKKMVFVGGPRQCGKTYMSRSILDRWGGEYLNWDDARDRKRIQKFEFAPNVSLVVFDELHKAPKWKSWIKGLYDTRDTDQSYLVTGSARLDVYRRGGDSLMGRYHYWRLHPFTLDECPPSCSPAEALQRLMTVGGFPEPFLHLDEQQARRWRRDRTDRIIRDDIRDLENIRMVSTLGNLVELLRERVSSQLSLANLAADIEVSAKTVKHWIDLLARMYMVFIVPPYSGKLSRTLQKAQRVYFYDNLDVETSEDKLLGARFENLVATHLLKRIQFLEDCLGERMGLFYLRDRDDREVDFVITRGRKVEELIEVKYSDESVSSSLKYYAGILKPRRAVQIVYGLQRPRFVDGIEVSGPLDYFQDPPWQNVRAVNGVGRTS
jgi:predicted AAA+ superfamily ATPase